MKIQLPDGSSHELDESCTIEEKIQKVEELIAKWDEVICNNWINKENESVKYFLDSLSNYLVWHKDPKNDEEDDDNEKCAREDKYVMSRNKTNRLYRGRRDILFTDLSKELKEKLFGERGME